MYQIGIISRAGRELTLARAELGQYTYFRTQSFTDAPNAVSVLKSKKLDALVVIVDSFQQKQLSLIDKIRAFHTGLPILFLTAVAHPEMQDQVLKVEKSILLGHHTDLSDLGGIIIRLIKGQKVYNRHYKRQRALQSAAIESDDRIAHGCILDMASGGARLRAFKNEYQKGDKFTLKIPLPYLKKTYVVRAEVIWSAQEPVTVSHPTSSQIMGLKFLSVAG